MTEIEFTNALRGDLGELYFKHLSQQRGYGYIRLEDIFNTFTPNEVLEFKKGFDRISVAIPEEIAEEIRRVCKPIDVNGTPSFVFDFFTCRMTGSESLDDINYKNSRDFSWVEIKTGNSHLSSHQDAVRQSCKIKFSVFMIPNVDQPPSKIRITGFTPD